MLILAVDTTHNGLSAAVYDALAQRLLASKFEEMPRGHAEKLPAMIAQVMGDANIAFKNLGKLVTTTGPGSFSGVRIGLSAAKGFALALDIPMVGIGSLEAIAAGVEGFEKSRVLAAFDARRNEVYVQLFEHGLPVTQPAVLSPDEAAQICGDEPTLIVGTASEMLQDLNSALQLSNAPSVPDASVIARLGAQRLPNEPVHPIYLRKADAKAQAPLLKVAAAKIDLIAATTDHCEVLSEIHRQGFADHWSATSITESLQSPNTIGHIAMDKDGEPLGFIMVRGAAGEVEILTIAVQINARRRKVASGLIAKIIADAKQADCTKIFLEVSIDNFSAKHLYDAHGFEVCGTRKNYYTGQDGQKQDALIMAKIL